MFLDVGCAYGYAVELAVQNGYEAYGFDASEHAVSEAKKLVGDKRIKQGLITEVLYKAKSFDVISLFDVFEHLSDPIGDMKQLTNYLADDGVMIIATGDAKSFAAKILGVDGHFYPSQHLFFLIAKI